MLQPRTTLDYDSKVTSTSKSVLLEVMTTLGEYKDSLVLIGGWTPYFLLERKTSQTAQTGFGATAFQHVGSIDIDLAVNPETISGQEYKTIVQLLLDRGYAQDPNIQYRLNRTLSDIPGPIGIDFLTTQPPLGEGRGKRHRKVQPNLPARATRHLELAFQFNQTLRLEGDLPEKGGAITVDFKIASVTSMIGLKGLALGERYKEKDAYDIYTLMRYFGNGIQEVVGLLKPHIQEPGLKEGLGNIREKFKNDKDAGPSWIANFFASFNDDERTRVIQDSFQTVDTVLKDCGF